jgi:uncharacterized protein YrrD
MFMIITIKNMLGSPVMSLQTGLPLARIDAAIINPHNLKVVAFYVSGPMVDMKPAVVFSEDIREFGDMGVIVDSSDNIMSPEGMVRLGEVIAYQFSLDNIQVIDQQKHKLGRVENYTLDPISFMIQQLYLKPTWIKSFSIANLTIGRQQIVAIDNQKITVKSPTVRDDVSQKVANLAPAASDFDNPFRKPKPVADSSEHD